jgi:hypothetical protein
MERSMVRIAVLGLSLIAPGQAPTAPGSGKANDMTPEEKRAALEGIEASLHRSAMKVLETPESEREAIYEIVRQSLEDADRVIPQKKGFIDQYMIWLRSLVGIIEAGGGARGGTA